ncbi:LPXTG-domain-containing protein [Streptococcus urinalis FB127-CNA-2]|uniref:Cross-wall-targeting lipoprotein signal n=2 Tax=Streptococcus TaxID=1301 RepID=G5KDW1_9STRE|nr:SspB-related isopeptide-forming adhesin [Streptococcus urinalis]EHJ57442.1 putative cross-wall-targeting lipoprotein signal [Streptococcus urinalis 2285-97]EKS18306.1 LPXTG-domain-containing protein [Streptococcus urinalis FB127-CNA-2]VEF32820.1 cell wall surface anchor family protein [Streptococcus urinalis]
MNNTQQGHGFFRKSKAYGLVCAIALAGAFTLATSQVSADQVTTQATTQTVTQNQAETVTSTQLDKAVDTAKIVGVAVTTTAAVNHATTTDAQADLSNQTQTVKDVTAKAQANTQAIKNASAENAKIDAENKAEAERIAQQNKAGQEAVDARNKAGQEAVDARNKAKQQAQDDQKSKIDAENKAEAERINKLNAEAQANVDNQNKIARLKADQTNAQLKANYEKAKLAYEKAVEDRKNLVAYDVTFDGFGKSETATGFGQKTADVVTVDKDGNFVISEPQFDTDGTFGHTKVTGKFNYTVNFDEKTQSAVVTITGVQLNSWQLDITRKTTAVNHDITATYKDLAGNVLYTTKYDGLQSIGAQTINKSFAFNKVITLADGQSSDELMFLKTEPRWLVSAPSSLYAKLTYKTAPLPEKPIEPKMVTPDLKNYTPVPFVPKDYKPQPITPETFTPEKFTPAQPKVKPHVAIPEKVNYSVSVHPVLVPAANPSKAVIDEAGQSVNGKTVLPNATLDYVAKQNFSQYKGIKASAEAIAKGFAFVDQPNEALGELTVKSIKASNGDDVSSLLEMRHVLSKDTLDQKLQSLIKEAGISPVGEFYMWIAKDPQAFYKAYVQKGLDITYNLSFKVKKEFTKGQIQNGVAQIDFGNGYTGNIVVNDLTTPEVHKDVLDKEDGKSINNGTVKLGDEVTYKLEGWVVPANRGYDLFEYKFVDQLQRTHDLYLRDKVVAKVDVTLKDGTVIKKGTNLGEYTETVYNQTTGRYELAFKKEFLAKVSRESEFGADDFIVVKRIKAGDVYNTADLYVNGYKVKSETVVTHTPEKPKPVEPKKGVPTTPAKGLPQTGEAGMSSLTAIGAIILSALGFAGVKKRKEN